MRRAVLGIVVVLMGTGCVAPDAADPAAHADPIEILPSPTPFTQVTAGPVSAIVPEPRKPSRTCLSRAASQRINAACGRTR